MSYSRFLSLTALAALLSQANSDPNSVCNSYGVDFVDEGDYFINSNSNEPFTCVSTFQGCNDDIADVLLVDPAGDEHLCSRITSTVPDGDPKLSTCPLLKSQLSTGDYMILVLGDNADGFPFAWQRDIFLEVGPQATSTVTSTVVFSTTTTPIITTTQTSTFTDVKTTGPLTTITVPSATATITKTVTPAPVTATRTFTFTQTSAAVSFKLATTTKTVTATCTKPGRGPHDKPCKHTPTKVHAAAMETPTGGPKLHRYVRKSDRAVDIKWARARIEAAKQRRDAKVQEGAMPLQRRGADSPTVTVTAPTPVVTTTTVTAPTSTLIISTVVSTTTTTTLPPVTVSSGLFTNTVTLATPTKTAYTYALTTTTRTFTVSATFTKTTTVTPQASVPACKSAGGHF